jgi:hypothetical protein
MLQLQGKIYTNANYWKSTHGKIKKVKQSHNTPMEAQGERMYSSCLFTTSALDGGEWLASRPGRALAPEEGPPTPRTHLTEVWVGSRADPDTEAKGKIHIPLPRIEPRSSGRPVRNQTLYWRELSGSHMERYDLQFLLFAAPTA